MTQERALPQGAIRAILTSQKGEITEHKIYQALAVGRALITARTPAIGEFFKEGAHLITVPPGDAPALARAIEALMRDRGMMRRLAEAGGAYVRAEVNSRRIAERLFEILEGEKSG